jgi:indole-3-glycerol phosphate synthase
VILDDIAAYKRIEVESRKKDAANRYEAPTGTTTRDFAAALRRPEGALPRIIAEVKKASPSKGIIRPDFDHVGIAKSYAHSGAAAISVLTDEKFFQGHLDYLSECRASVSLPVIRKDFIIDESQIFEARIAGADAILLIVALLDVQTLRSFQAVAKGLGMASLVEVHDKDEMEKAIESGAEIIGINNRDLQTFKVDIGTTFRLVPLIPPGKTIVSESGISTSDDLKRLADANVDAALIGETFMRAPDPGEKLRELINR